MSAGRKKLGHLMVEAGLLSGPQVEEALSAQIIHAGRLGSNLVELRATDLNTVSRCLSEQMRVPAASPEMLDAIDPATLARLRKDVCATCKAVPLKFVDNALHVAMLDPLRKDVVAKIENAARAKLVTYVVPQLRLLFYLEAHYKIPRSKRFLRAKMGRQAGSGGAPPPPLGASTNAAQTGQERRHYLAPTLTSKPTATTLSPVSPFETGVHPALAELASQERAALSGTHPAVPPGTGVHAAVAAGTGVHPAVAARTGVHPAVIAGTGTHPAVPVGTDTHPTVSMPAFREDADAEEEQDGTVFLDQLSDAAQSDDAFDFEVDLSFDDEESDEDAAGGQTFDGLMAQLGSAESREAIIRTLVIPFFPGTTMRALFLMRGELAVGLGCWGATIPPDQVRALVVPAAANTLFKKASDEQALATGTVAQDPMQRMIATYLKSPAAEHACVMPVVVNKRVVNLLCIQSADPFPETYADQITQFSQAAADAYIRVIKNTKR